MTAEELTLRREMFTILVGAVRPLTVEEIYAQHDILRLCWPLAMVVNSYVQLAHMSVKEFLLRPSGSPRNSGGTLRLTVHESNAYLAHKCLSQLNQDRYGSLKLISSMIRRNTDFETSLKSEEPDPFIDTTFYEYACLSWNLHLTAVSNPTKRILEEARGFLKSNHFVYRSETLYDLKAHSDMGPILEIKAELLSWLAGLPPELRKSIPMHTYFLAPFELLHQQYQFSPASDVSTALLCQFRLGQYANLGESTEIAFKYYFALAKECNATFDAENVLNLKASYFLGREHIAKGELSKAEQLLSSVAAFQRRILGPEHPDYIISLGYASLAKWYINDFECSAQAQAEAQAGLQRYFGPLKLEVLKSKLSHAKVLEAQRKLGEALRVFEDIWKTWMPIVGPDNPLSLMVQCSMGAIYRKLRRYEEAKQHLIQNLAACQRLWSLSLACSVNYALQLALLYRETGNVEEAEALLELVSTPGVTEPWFERVCQVAHISALLCIDRKDDGAARLLLRNILDTAVAQGREANNRELLWIRLKLAELLRSDDDFEEALSIFANIVKPCGEETPIDHEPMSPLILSIAEEGLKMVRRAENKGAEWLLEDHHLAWVRPEDFWIIFGGETTDTAWLNEPQR